MKTGGKAGKSEEITGSPYKVALEIKDALKSKGKAHAMKALSLNKSPKTQRRNNVPANRSREDDNETFCIYCNDKYRHTHENWIMCQECKECMKTVLTWRINWDSSLVMCAEIDVLYPMRL
jgi:hypothetical protein